MAISLRRRRLIFRLMCVSLILYFWANGLAGLDRYPKIYQDESWIAAPGYTFWTDGYFGTDLFKGFYGMEQHFYTFVPLFPIMVGGSLRLFGLGLFQARLAPLILSMLTLALTYRLGAQLFSRAHVSRAHGLLAVAILVGWRIAAPIYYLPTGIPLADMGRIVRYDIAVPVFGLAALTILIGGHSIKNTDSRYSTLSSHTPKGNHALVLSPPRIRGGVGGGVSAINSTPSSRRFFAAGLMIGLATLCHYYGGFWLPALSLAALWCWRWTAARRLAWMGVGVILPLIPWGLFALSGWDDYRAQFRQFSNRFGLLDPQFYLTNLSAEINRYQPLVKGADRQVGTWLAVLLFAIGLIWLANRALIRKQSAARMLLACLLVIVGLFALLVNLKTFTYLGTLWPLFALAVAAGFIHLWGLKRLWVILAALFVFAAAEGVAVENRNRIVEQTVTPYEQFTAEIAASLPAGSKVMGMPHFWLGLPQQDYYCILAPIDWTNPQYVADPVSFGEAAQRLRPDFVLFDQTMLNFMQQSANPNSDLFPLNQQILEYLRQQQAFLVSRFHDPTYGWMEIYRLAVNFPPVNLDSLG